MLLGLKKVGKHVTNLRFSPHRNLVKSSHLKWWKFASQISLGFALENKMVFPHSFQRVLRCCVFQPANACLRMRLHGWNRLKTLENDEKSTFSIMRMRGSCKAHEEKRGKDTFFIIFLCLQSFSTMQTHAFASRKTQHSD